MKNRSLLLTTIWMCGLRLPCEPGCHPPTNISKYQCRFQGLQQMRKNMPVVCRCCPCAKQTCWLYIGILSSVVASKNITYLNVSVICNASHQLLRCLDRKMELQQNLLLRWLIKGLEYSVEPTKFIVCLKHKTHGCVYETSSGGRSVRERELQSLVITVRWVPW